MNIVGPVHSHAHKVENGWVQHTDPTCEEYMNEIRNRIDVDNMTSTDAEIQRIIQSTVKELAAVQKAIDILREGEVTPYFTNQLVEYEYELSEDLKWLLNGESAPVTGA